MKSFIIHFIFIASVILVSISAASRASSSSNNNNNGVSSSSLNQDGDTDAQARAQSSSADVTRLRKAAYGGMAPGTPSMPCPKNYMFSCQPSMTAAPCSPAGGGAYGTQAAYSAPVPAYVSPLYAGQDISNGYSPGAIYYAPQPTNYPNANQYFQQY